MLQNKKKAGLTPDGLSLAYDFGKWLYSSELSFLHRQM